MYFAPHFTLNRVPIQAPAMLPQARIKPVRQSTKSYQIKITSAPESIDQDKQYF